MYIDDFIFDKHKPNFDKLLKFGFLKKDNCFYFEQLFFDNSFKACITVNPDGKVLGNVYDLENNDIFLPLRVKNQTGAYVCEVKSAYEKLLITIRDNCFFKDFFKFNQSNRITNLIIKKYGDLPEFLWKKFQGTAVFRNPKSHKWYAIIMDVDRNKIQAEKTGLVEIINIKLSKQHVEEIIQNKGFYSGYHMNKKSWISIVLDDYINDELIMNLIEESHKFTEK